MTASSDSFLKTLTQATTEKLATCFEQVQDLVNPGKDQNKLCKLIIISSLLVILFILLFPYCINHDEVLVDGKVIRNVYADRYIEVQDVVLTRQKRLEAAQSVLPVYREDKGSSQILEDRVVHNLESIELMRERLGTHFSQQKEQLSELMGKSLNSNEINALAIVSPRDLRNATLDTLDSLLKNGVTSEDTRRHSEEVVRESIPQEYQADKALVRAVTLLISAKIRSTRQIDMDATEETRKMAVKSVKPIFRVYGKGEMIIERGQEPTDVQIAALKKQGMITDDNRWLHILGVCLLTVSLLCAIWIYFVTFERKNYYNPSYVSLLNTFLVITLGGMVAWHDAFPGFMFLYPMPIFAFMVTIFTNPRIAIFMTNFVLIMGGMALQLPLETISILTLSCLAGIMYLIRHPVGKNRFEILKAGFCVGIVQALSVVVITLIYEPSIIPMKTLIHAVLGLISGLLASMITLGALPIFEKWFKLITPFTLLELANQDLPVLKRMQLEAPGTFHHSLIIAMLAESASEAIGANGLLARVGSMYHDIGKLRRPLFFIENQAYFGSENPHDKLSCRLSKMIVMSHPRDGIEMGRKIGLPEEIIAFMPEHHGTLLAGYFYNKAVLEEGEENVAKEDFRYPGPKPQCKETAIVMLADACESAVRALKNPTQAQLEERIDKIIKQRVDDNQFSDAAITFRDIQIVRDTFVRVLRAMQHNRIEYQQQAVAKEFNYTKHPLMHPAINAANAETVQTIPISKSL